MKAKTKTTATTEEATPALVPKLRFPEFRKKDGWHIKPFEKLFTIGNGRDHKHLSPGDFPVYGSGGYMRSVDEYLYDGESVCIGRKGTINNPMFLTGRFWTVDTLFYTHSFKQCLPKFVWAIFQQIDWLKHNEAGGIPSLSKSNIEKIKTAIPTPAEQQKIAECLSSVDELMAAQAREVDALKTHKKGRMQQLFPREGESQPRLRFSSAGDWVVAALPEVAFFQEGPGIMAVDFHAEGVPLVRLAGVSGPVVTLDGCNYLNPAKVAKKWAHFRLAVNDLLISTSATFGLSSLVAEAAAGAVFYTGLIRFRPSSGRLDRGYLEIFLGSPHFARQAETVAVGGGIKHFGPSHLKQMEIPIPPLPEQQRIATCLSSLDALITAETQKHEALKTHKRGLMQQLFPSPIP